MDYLGRLNHSRCKNRALPSLRRLAVFVAGLLVLSIAAAPALAQRKKVERVAVLTFKSIGTTKEMGEAVAEILRTELVDVGDFELVERGQIQALLKEQKLQLQDVIDEQTAVKIGRLSGAKLVVIGSIVKLGYTFTLNSRFIDVQTGITRIGKNIRGNSENEISNMCRQLAYVIAGRTYVEKLPPQPRTPRKPVVRERTKREERERRESARLEEQRRRLEAERRRLEKERKRNAALKREREERTRREGESARAASGIGKLRGQTIWVKTKSSNPRKRYCTMLSEAGLIVKCSYGRLSSKISRDNVMLKCSTLPDDTANILQRYLGLSALKVYDWRQHKNYGTRYCRKTIGGISLEIITGGAQRALGSVASRGGKKATATIKRVWLVHNKYRTKKKVMWIHTNFLIKNHKGRRGRFTVFFRYQGKSAWISARQSANSQYKTNRGNLTVQEAFTPKHENSRFSDFKISIPYIEFNRGKGKHNLEAVVQIHDEKGKNLKQQSVRFTYTHR